MEQVHAWFDVKTKAEVMNVGVCAALQTGLETFGLVGIDRFFSFMIVQKLQQFQKLQARMFRQSKEHMALHRDVAESLRPLSATPDSLRPYLLGVQKCAKVWAAYSQLIMHVGQIQLIRRHIAQELDFSCQFDSKYLSSTLAALNAALLSDIRAHYAEPETKPYPGGKKSVLVAEVSSYLECAGIVNPLNKIYVTTKKPDYFPLHICLFVVSQLQRLTFSRAVNSLVSKKPGDLVDGPVLVVGVVTLMKQFHARHTLRLLAYLGQFIRTQIELAEATPTDKLREGVSTALFFLEQFCQYSGAPRKAATVFVPEYLFGPSPRMPTPPSARTHPSPHTADEYRAHTRCD